MYYCTMCYVLLCPKEKIDRLEEKIDNIWYWETDKTFANVNSVWLVG